MVKSTSYNLDSIFHALADPTRRAIVHNISHQTLTVSEIAQPFRISLAAISKHLKVLEHANLIKRKKQGSYAYIRLNAEALITAEQWLNHYRAYWDKQLDTLKHYLEQETS